MNPIEALNILEKKIELLIHNVEIAKKENNEINNLLRIEREKVSSLEHEIAMLKKEKYNFDFSKQEIRNKIEGLINKLSGGSLPSTSDMDFSGNHNQSKIHAGFSRGGGINMVDDDNPGYGVNEI